MKRDYDIQIPAFGLFLFQKTSHQTGEEETLICGDPDVLVYTAIACCCVCVFLHSPPEVCSVIVRTGVFNQLENKINRGKTEPILGGWDFIRFCLSSQICLALG